MSWIEYMTLISILNRIQIFHRTEPADEIRGIVKSNLERMNKHRNILRKQGWLVEGKARISLGWTRRANRNDVWELGNPGCSLKFKRDMLNLRTEILSFEDYAFVFTATVRFFLQMDTTMTWRHNFHWTRCRFLNECNT